MRRAGLPGASSALATARPLEFLTPAMPPPLRRHIAGTRAAVARSIAAILVVLAASGAARCSSGGDALPDRRAADDERLPSGGVRTPRPDCSIALEPSDSLAVAISTASEGSVICLGDGTWRGPVQVPRSLVLRGNGRTRVLSDGTGSTIEITGDDVSLFDLQVDGSGGRFDTNDAAVRISSARVLVEDVAVRNALFGLLAEGASQVTVRRLDAEGGNRGPRGLRGDAVRFWGTRDSLLEFSRVHHGRDVVMWYSDNVRISDNRMLDGRYGTHFMYSNDCVVERNTYARNAVGVFVMYSHGIEMRDNTMTGGMSAGGLGVGLKDSGNIVVEDNRIVYNRAGIHLDNSPSSREESNRIERNEIRLGLVGVLLNGGTARNVFRGNTFQDNATPVRIEDGRDGHDIEWLGNRFDDYQGYDLDGDCVGDLPYELRSFANAMTGRFPALQFFAGTPALWMVDAAGHVSPLLRPRSLLVDPTPGILGCAEGPHEG